jgi:alkylated DNA repair dioxygenase AlkB
MLSQWIIPFVSTMTLQTDLFEETSKPAGEWPEGMRYTPELITSGQEGALLARLPSLPFKEFDFHGFLGKRRTVSFGWRYDFNCGGLGASDPIPEFLLPLRNEAAAFAGLAPEALEHVLVIEYRDGAGIGWHRDRPVFGDVIGVSLLAPCTFRLRRRQGSNWERRTFTATPRSAYLLRGPSRSEWEHSIQPLDQLRYSVTFRTMAGAAPARANKTDA